MPLEAISVAGYSPAYAWSKGVSMPTPLPFVFLQEQMAIHLGYCQHCTYLIGADRNTLSYPLEARLANSRYNTPDSPLSVR